MNADFLVKWNLGWALGAAGWFYYHPNYLALVLVGVYLALALIFNDIRNAR